MASIFSRIIAGEIPSYKVDEDANYYAFLDINPLTEGHTLVVPKQEVDYLFDLDDRTLAGMMLFAKRVARKIERQIECKRVAVVVLGLEVPHAHIHLIPIRSEADVDFRREKLSLSPEALQAIADKLNR
ncbi:HIT family protein [Alistipes sp.]|uniref:HIT family protein n=1 Tax=Alistipes sp. TaxID=1872444 RepID=UPI003A85DA68